ncbi:peptidylprolyl isomerase [Paracoccus sediminicola]|uniref:peptidylprolyl isomerase n=1 Tax=Paracoccus sediminicola TaxID=3017783 RepID=UPI0022F0D060|nr:peptidylprolyl isomerase [Paracoccus sediminicola]WBU56024.1 peptidylprolyl isomerase [Paracoccus sediminicola]
MFKLTASTAALIAALSAAPALAQDTETDSTETTATEASEAPADSGAATESGPATAETGGEDEAADSADSSADADSADSAAQDGVAQSEAPAANADPATVVATVNGEDITLGQMAAMQLRMPPEMAQMPAEELWDAMLDEMIRQAALAQLGESDQTPLDQAALVNLRRDYLTRAAMAQIVDFEPSDDEIQAAYAEAFPEDDPINEYDADHILVETEEAANAIIEELEGGADFAELAAERSTDTGSAQNGGDLGWFTLDRMVPEFSTAVEGMEPGSTSSEPVQSQFGWHIIKLNETRVMEPPALEEIRPQLVEQVRRERLESEVEKVTSEATVERSEDLDPALLEQNILGVE